MKFPVFSSRFKPFPAPFLQVPAISSHLLLCQPFLGVFKNFHQFPAIPAIFSHLQQGTASSSHFSNFSHFKPFQQFQPFQAISAILAILNHFKQLSTFSSHFQPFPVILFHSSYLSQIQHHLFPASSSHFHPFQPFSAIASHF